MTAVGNREMPESQEEQWVSIGDRDRVHKMKYECMQRLWYEWSNDRILPSRMTVYEILHVSIDGCGNYGWEES